jgi:nucleoside-diphosphate-sugar epimerase
MNHRLALRAASGNASPDRVSVGEIGGATEWRNALAGASVVVHLAARVHIMRETASDALAEFRRVNVAGTERLARMAASAGVRRLVYVSSIKVNGEATEARPFSASDEPCPLDPYGMSKWEAEQVLAHIGAQSPLEIVIVRPPLVYGPGVRGNFLRLMKLAGLGLPLPLGGARNLRSLVFVRNLADALVTCAVHPHAMGRTFLVSDGEDISTADLFRRLAHFLRRTPRLFSVPDEILSGIASATGRAAELQRLFGSLQVDASPLRRDLGWTPPHTIDEGLAETAAWYLQR